MQAISALPKEDMDGAPALTDRSYNETVVRSSSIGAMRMKNQHKPIAKFGEERAYDSEGRIYRDKDGSLRDREDDSFSLPPIPLQREVMRQTMFAVVDAALSEDSDFPTAKLTYTRLRLEGASNLEARALMATAWMEETQIVLSSGVPTDGARLSAMLDKLHPGGT
jgi:hypothetical protein